MRRAPLPGGSARVRLLAEQLEALVEARRDPRARDRDAIGPKTVRGFSASSSQSPLSARSIVSASHGLDRSSALAAAARMRESSCAGSGSTSPTGSRRTPVPRRAADLLLTSGAAARTRASSQRPPLAQERDQRVCVGRGAARGGTRRSSSRAWRSRRSPGLAPTRSSVNRSTSSSDMIVVSPSGAQPSSARSSSARARCIPPRGTRPRRPRRAAWRASFRPPRDVRDVRVDRQLGPERAKHDELLGVFDTWSSPRITWVIPSSHRPPASASCTSAAVERRMTMSSSSTRGNSMRPLTASSQPTTPSRHPDPDRAVVLEALPSATRRSASAAAIAASSWNASPRPSRSRARRATLDLRDRVDHLAAVSVFSIGAALAPWPRRRAS